MVNKAENGICRRQWTNHASLNAKVVIIPLTDRIAAGHHDAPASPAAKLSIIAADHNTANKARG